MMNAIAVRKPTPLVGCGNVEGARGQDLRPRL